PSPRASRRSRRRCVTAPRRGGSATPRPVPPPPPPPAPNPPAASVAGTSAYTGATSDDEPLTVNKAQLSITTQIHDAAHNDVGGAVSVSLGSVVHDTATVTGQVAGFDIGAISFTLDGSTLANDPSSDGSATARSVDSDPLHAGSYTYAASVAGNSDYIGATSDDEPLTVNKAQLSITTPTHDAPHNDVGGAFSVSPGSGAHDTPTATGQVAGFDTGAINSTLPPTPVPT